MADQLEGARTSPVKFRDLGDGSVAEILAAPDQRYIAPADALPLATRTTTTTSPVLDAKGHNGALIVVVVTTPGTGSIDVSLIFTETGEFDIAAAQVTGITSAGRIALLAYPGAVVPTGYTEINKVASLPLPRHFAVQVGKSDASGWEYKASVVLL